MTTNAIFLTVCLTAPTSGDDEAQEAFGLLTGAEAPADIPADGLEGAFRSAESRAGECAVRLLPAGGGVNASATPLLILEPGADDDAAAPKAEVLCNARWDSPMCGLSLEDAALLEGLDVVVRDDAPSRTKNPLGDGVTAAPPGAAAWLRLTGGRKEERARMAARILRRAASIMLRRLDAARARLAESNALRAALGVPTNEA